MPPMFGRILCKLGLHRDEFTTIADCPDDGSPEWMMRKWLFERVCACTRCGRVWPVGKDLRDAIARETTEES